MFETAPTSRSGPIPGDRGMPRRSDYPSSLNSRFPFALIALVCIVIVIVLGRGPNLGLCLLSTATLFIGCWLCWRPGEPAVILFIFGYQWIQASIAIFVANLKGLPINETAELSVSNMGDATALSLLGLLTIVGCFRLTAGPTRKSVIQRASLEASRVSVGSLVIAYVLSIIGALVVQYVATIFQELQQPILALLSFKDAVFLIIAYVGFKRGGQFRTLFYFACAFEFITSLTGYFSEFQIVFIYTFIAMLASGMRLHASKLIGIGVLIAVAIFAGVVWTAVKVEYRWYLNGGTAQQVVSVGPYDALRTLGRMVFSVDGAQLAYGVDRFVSRLSYVEFFGASINNVPALVKHTEGALWGNALVHPFTPRVFFPNKPEIDSSKQTNKYTGVRVAGREQGAQISIGYMGESYIDFGFWGMFFPLALYGAFAGWCYRKVLSLKKFAGLISMGLSVPLLMGGFYLNAESVKIVGHLIVTALAIFVAHALFADRIRAMLLGKRKISRNRLSARMPGPRPSVPSRTISRS